MINKLQCLNLHSLLMPLISLHLHITLKMTLSKLD